MRVRACVRACVRAGVRARTCVRVCVRHGAWGGQPAAPPAPLPLTGFQVPPEAEADFKRAQRKLREDFTFEEVEGRAREVFNMFIQ